MIIRDVDAGLSSEEQHRYLANVRELSRHVCAIRRLQDTGVIGQKPLSELVRANGYPDQLTWVGHWRIVIDWHVRNAPCSLSCRFLSTVNSRIVITERCLISLKSYVRSD